MLVNFFKYHGAGNDFVMIDGRNLKLEVTPDLIRKMCHRRFGAGADGLILLTEHPEFDFEMHYFNNDGFRGSMCGNGARCTTHFAHYLDVIGEEASFTNNGRAYKSRVDTKSGRVQVLMPDMDPPKRSEHGWTIDTGCPHLIVQSSGISLKEAQRQGRDLRFHPEYNHIGGINVNFAEKRDDAIHITTYERGVEDITWACGTGAVATAIASHADDLSASEGRHRVNVASMGGLLSVEFNYERGKYRNVILEGPALMVYEGRLDTADL